MNENRTVCKHTTCPSGYAQWHQWAEEKANTHRQIECPDCGRWSIWVKKEPA